MSPSQSNAEVILTVWHVPITQKVTVRETTSKKSSIFFFYGNCVFTARSSSILWSQWPVNDGAFTGGLTIAIDGDQKKKKKEKRHQFARLRISADTLRRAADGRACPQISATHQTTRPSPPRLASCPAGLHRTVCQRHRWNPSKSVSAGQHRRLAHQRRCWRHLPCCYHAGWFCRRSYACVVSARQRSRKATTSRSCSTQRWAWQRGGRSCVVSCDRSAGQAKRWQAQRRRRDAGQGLRTWPRWQHAAWSFLLLNSSMRIDGRPVDNTRWAAGLWKTGDQWDEKKWTAHKPKHKQTHTHKKKKKKNSEKGEKRRESSTFCTPGRLPYLLYCAVWSK